MRSIAILGAGPIGLEAALAARDAGWIPTVYERAPTAAGHVRNWGHVRLFTPWSMNVSLRMRAALGDAAPDGAALPTGDELAERLLDPVAAQLDVRPSTTVLAVGRRGLLKHESIGAPDRAARPFRVLTQDATGQRLHEHDAVIDATGVYGNPNRLGDGGIDAIGERELDARIGRRIPDARALAGRTVLLTGSGHSAQTAARDLALLARDAPGTKVVWAVRGADPDFGLLADDPLPERDALHRVAHELRAGQSRAVEVRTGVVTEALAERDGRLAVTLRNGEATEVVVDDVLALNGGVPDASLYRQLQVHECYATVGPMKLAAALLGAAGGDCLAQASHGPETLANPEPGFFILGAKSYGRNSQFLLRIGWEQVDDVFSSLLPCPAP